MYMYGKKISFTSFLYRARAGKLEYCLK